MSQSYQSTHFLKYDSLGPEEVFTKYGTIARIERGEQKGQGIDNVRNISSNKRTTSRGPFCSLLLRDIVQFGHVLIAHRVQREKSKKKGEKRGKKREGFARSSLDEFPVDHARETKTAT